MLLKVFTILQFTHCGDKEFQSLTTVLLLAHFLTTSSLNVFEQFLVMSSSTAAIQLKNISVNVIHHLHNLKGLQCVTRVGDTRGGN